MARIYDFSHYSSGPRTARGGIKAQSARGAFAKSWWAQRWISVLEGFKIGTRLERGKSYARRGQVLSIDISEGLVEAMVQGSEINPYKVKIGVKTISDENWTKLAKGPFSQPVIAAKLLAGEMPDDIEKLFVDAGLSLFPSEYNDLKTFCSCPDFSNPCKHIAAVYYLLGEEFDRDPFLVFQLRGMTREKLLELLSGGDELPKRTGTKRARKKVPIVEPVKEAEPLPDDAKSFWAMSLASQETIPPAKMPVIHASLPKRLGSLPFWRAEQSLIKSVEDIYRIASERAMRSED